MDVSPTMERASFTLPAAPRVLENPRPCGQDGGNRTLSSPMKSASLVGLPKNLPVCDQLRPPGIPDQLRRALEEGQFVLHYQPIIDMATRRLSGAEALIRWNHPDRGLVFPDEFIPIAEDCGLIVSIGEWVLAESCRQAAAWSRSVSGPLFVAVNLSATQFQDGDLSHIVAAALAESGLPASLLELELTESIMMADSETVLASLARLDALGVRLSIDDFGTGYSSLAYLKRFKVHKLKIDKSFVAEAHHDEIDAAIIGAIIQMARAMRIETVAEGVEKPETLAFLASLQCDLVQGYLFGRPMPAEAFCRALTPDLAAYCDR